MKVAPLLAFLAAAGCAHARGGRPDRLETVDVGGAVFRVRYSPGDEEAVRQVRGALVRAAPAAERWGRLYTPVVITIHPTHAELEAAVRRRGHAWLRAWARYASVDLQSPRTWSTARASDAQMSELLTHELTHCVMYQLAGDEAGWRGREIPLWFREGMASVTAGPTPVAKAEGRPQPPARNLLASADLPRGPESSRVYATADRAFRLLLERHGEECVHGILVAMTRGMDFADAFQEAVGVPVQEFERGFERHESR